MLELKEFENCAANWANCSSAEQLQVELLSLHFETHHQFDTYRFIVDKDDFLSYETRKPVRPFILRDTPIRAREGIAYDHQYNWAKNNEEGLAVWVSPPSETYPDTKIVLSEIVGRGREKIVINRTLLADIDAADAVNIANLFSAHSLDSSVRFFDPEKVRETLFDIRKNMSIIDLFDLFVDDPELIEIIRTEQDVASRDGKIEVAKEYSQRLRNGESAAAIHSSMVADGFIGTHDISCPPGGGSFSEVMANGVLTFGVYKRVENCGQCGVLIGKLIKKGYHCTNCNGEYQGC